MSNWKCFHALLLAVVVSLAACEPAADDGQPATAVAAPEARKGEAESNGAEPAEAGDAESEVEVIAETLPYAEVGNKLVYGHFVFPAEMVDPLPGLIMIHEWRGLDDEIRGRAERIAAEGFVVLAIDLFSGRVAASLDDARPMMIEVFENPELANQNLSQAYEFLALSGQAPRIGVLGWDFGGDWTLNAALLLPNDLDAAVIYYGAVTGDPERLAAMNVPVLGLFGAEDPLVPADNVEAFETALENLGKDYAIEIYPGAGHSFADPSAEAYDAEIAEQAWRRTLDFLGHHLLATVD